MLMHVNFLFDPDFWHRPLDQFDLGFVTWMLYGPILSCLKSCLCSLFYIYIYYLHSIETEM